MQQPVERVLDKIGKVGKYQKLLVAYLFFIAGFVNYLLMGPTYIYMNPVFQCTFADELVDESIACDRLTECAISNDYTLVAHMALYCQQQAERNLIQAINPIGSIFGLFIVNFLSDYRGKKFALIVAQFAAIGSIVIAVVGGYAKSIATLAVSQFLGGFAGYSMIIMAYIYPSEVASQEFRQKSLLIINYSWSLTSVLLGVLSFYGVAWQTYLLLCVLIPMLAILVLSFFFLVEGPNFLYSIGKEKECLASLKTIALYNGTLAEYKECLQAFRYESGQQKPQQVSISQALKAVLRDSYYKKMILTITVCELGASLYYVATNYSLFEIGFDYGINMTATGLIELLSFLFLQFNLTKISRRKGMLAMYGTMTMLGLLFFIKPIEHSRIAAFVLIGVIRFFGTIAYALVLLLLTEVFPSQVQAICAGIIESIAQLGNFLGPITITLCINMQIYPVILLSFVLVVTLLLPLWFMKEKRDAITGQRDAVTGQREGALGASQGSLKDSLIEGETVLGLQQ